MAEAAFIVSPYDTNKIAEAIIAAVSNDELVDQAAEISLRTVTARWNSVTNGAQVWDIYDRASANLSRERAC